jgi:hypothetical protein
MEAHRGSIRVSRVIYGCHPRSTSTPSYLMCKGPPSILVLLRTFRYCLLIAWAWFPACDRNGCRNWVAIFLNGQFIIVYTCKPHINHKYSLVIITPRIFSVLQCCISADEKVVTQSLRPLRPYGSQASRRISIRCKMSHYRLFAIAFFWNACSQLQLMRFVPLHCLYLKSKRSQKVDPATLCTEWKSSLRDW